MYRFERVVSFCVLILFVSVLPQTASANLADVRSTYLGGGLEAGGNWASAPDGEGFQIAWEITQGYTGLWHYRYTLLNESGDGLTPEASHTIFELSTNITSEDLFNFSGDIQSVEFRTFGEAPSNPEFPDGEDIFGVKFDLTGDQCLIEFDSTRQPMWGDFYSKGGGGSHPSYVYNISLGTPVELPNSYLTPPVDVAQNPLHKILVPDTVLPEPATVALLALGTLTIRRRRR